MSPLRQRMDHWLRRHPLFGAALVAVAAIGGAKLSLVWLAAAFAGIVVCGWLAARGKRLLVWLLVASLASGVFLNRTATAEREGREVVAAGPLRLEAKIVGDPKGDSTYWVAAARVISGPHKNTKLSWQGGGKMPVKGSFVRATGRAERLPITGNPGEFDKAEWLRQQGIVAVFKANPQTSRVATGPFVAWLAKMRQGFRIAVTDGLDETSRAAAVIRAVVIGEMPADADELVAAYRDSGTLHVFSVSGLHVAMVATMAWFVLRWCGVPRRWAVLALIPVVFGYTWITGNSAPALRSAWMTSVFLGAFVLRRQGDLLNSLGAVLLVGVLWDGRMIFQPGVQLSYGVVAAISVGVAFTERWFDRMKQPEIYVPLGLMTRRQALVWGMRRKCAQYLSVSTAAWAGSTPLSIWHFGVVTPVSILAGIPIFPMVYALLVLGLASAVVHPLVPSLSRGLNHCNGWLADATTRVAETFSAIPGGHFPVKKPQPFLLVYDLRHGAGAVCFSDGNSSVLLDAGDRSSFRYHVAPSLKTLGVAPDTAILSHPDGSHLGGGEKIWEILPIRQALLPVEDSRSPALRLWREAPVRLQTAQAGARLPFKKTLWLEVLYAPTATSIHTQADQRVAIFRLHWNGWKILFNSDAGTDTEAAILRSGIDCSADVIICGRPHHDTNLSDVFLTAVAPRAIIASNAAFPANEILPASQPRYWKSKGIQVFDQQKTGGVTITIGVDGELILRGFVDGSEIRIQPHIRK